MPRDAIEMIIGRAVIDPEFRQALKDDPEKALKGYVLTDEEREALQSLAGDEFDSLANDLGERVSRAGGLGGVKT